MISHYTRANPFDLESYWVKGQSQEKVMVDFLNPYPVMSQ